MDILRGIALTLALIIGFSVYGPREPIELSSAYESSEVDYIPSSLRSSGKVPVKPIMTRDQALETVAASKQLSDDIKSDEDMKTGNTPSDNGSETKSSTSSEATENAKQKTKNAESTKKSENKSKENNSTESTKKTNKESKKSTQETKPKTTYFDVPLSKDLQDYIFKVCKSYDIDPSIIVAVIWKESTYKTSAMGDNGHAYGLMQVQPRWHKDRMKKLGVTDLLDPYQNVLVGIDYLAELYHDRDSMKWALMAYNGGPSYANKMTKSGKVSGYASAVLQKQKELTR